MLWNAHGFHFNLCRINNTLPISFECNIWNKRQKQFILCKNAKNIKYNLFDSLSHVIYRIHFIWLFLNIEFYLFCFNIFLSVAIPEQAIHWCWRTIEHRQQTPIDTLEKEHHSYTFDVILYIVESKSSTSICEQHCAFNSP